MATGTVKWFNNAKGYGFVLAQESNDDLFIHYSSIQMDGYKSLKAGQQIEYDIQEGPKGLHAVNIRYVNGTTTEPTTPASATTSAPTIKTDNDNLHLNPMHDVPHPAAANGASNAAPSQAPAREVEVEVEEG